MSTTKKFAGVNLHLKAGVPPELSAPEEPKKMTPAEKKAAIKAAKVAEQEKEAKAKEQEFLKSIAVHANTFGPMPRVQSTTHDTKKFIDIQDLSPSHIGSVVQIRSRLEIGRKQGGKLFFAKLSQGQHSIQGVICVNGDAVPAEMVQFANKVPPQSIVDVEATVTKPEVPTKTSQCNLELQISKYHLLSESLPVLPFQLEDAARTNDPNAEDQKAVVNLDTRLNCRWLDMRTPASNAIFRLQSYIGQYFREYLYANQFIEIHSPKLIGAASEGGANVFEVTYFNRKAYLAQSPQLYKQMALQGDLNRVFEIAPVFRAEDSNTHRHLTEFVGLDLEMNIAEHYYEVLNVAEELFHHIFSTLASKHQGELAAVCNQYPFPPFVYELSKETIDKLKLGVVEENIPSQDEYEGKIRNRKAPVLRLPFPRAIALLNTVASPPLDPLEDIGTEDEKKLGVLMKARYGVDFYIVDRYPRKARPFYTMPCPDDPNFTNSYDMFMRGEEISSGAQRVHDPVLLEENIRGKGVDPALLKDYVDSFRLGAWPHGGFGIGLERVVMLYLGLQNIRYASLYPRDPHRLAP